MNFEIGRTYYAITYADPNFTMPGVEPFVFLGKNAFLEIEGDSLYTWQFQDALYTKGYAFGSERASTIDVRALSGTTQCINA